ncbi:hypothetical protein GCM10011344_37790 [Dokdonia pacifica]|uniref:Uncharacterized protein n=1 Tax=Dokdonia pacifica TaxID=1627892 RepID=A0A239B4T8_9FLAO|nr:hypothetical protein [Dokdonia pacifica]GGG33337.1 hypothetical protein GCM10011344_37790 [Dokdonia pacifica]SNS02591.1 hypothetical protein SAMN06265376_105327 [Dokdonia pacifica]
MKRASNSERLLAPRPIVMPSTITFCKLTIRKLYARGKRLGIAGWNNEADYADYIHNLWEAISSHRELKSEAKRTEDLLGKGDVIQLLSDTVMEQQNVLASK